jgi:O-antigen/teichoic acid export membrane protein
MLFFSFHPQFLIKKLIGQEELKIASRLLFILALSSPAILLNRFMQIVYGIRLEDFLFQKVLIIFNLAKIASVIYFFNNTKYDIVGYFFFCQLMTVVAGIVSASFAIKRYKYDFNLLLRSFRFSKEIFLKTKNIAFGSLFITATAILYYEIDPFVIARILGAEQVALYAIGLTLLSYFRALFGMLYGPFLARFNHFVGLKDEPGLRKIYKSTIILIAPIVIFPILTILALMKPFVYSWVGNGYSPSVVVSQFLVACFIYGFLSYPASILMLAQEKIRMLYIVNAILPLIYWTGIILTISHLGIAAFSLFKFVTFSILGVIFFIFSKNFLKMTTLCFLKKIMLPAIIPSVFLFYSASKIFRFLPVEKGNFNFFISASTICIISFFSILLYCLFSKEHRELLNNLYGKFIKRNEILLEQ